MTITIIPQLEDNYSYLLTYDNQAILIDPAESSSLLKMIRDQNVRLSHILITHHHQDHIGGVAKLKKDTSCEVIGPNDERIDKLDKKVYDQENFTIGPIEFRVIATPGHTKTHIVYYLEKEKILFSGDVLFSAGCGRLFEGSFEEMLLSLEKIKSLPDDTSIYFGHEYTLKNLTFAKTVEKDNQDISERLVEIKKLKCTSPTTIGLEQKINPFLRLEKLKNQNESLLDTFIRIRKKRDQF